MKDLLCKQGWKCRMMRWRPRPLGDIAPHGQQAPTYSAPPSSRHLRVPAVLLAPGGQCEPLGALSVRHLFYLSANIGEISRTLPRVVRVSWTHPWAQSQNPLPAHPSPGVKVSLTSGSPPPPNRAAFESSDGGLGQSQEAGTETEKVKSRCQFERREAPQLAINSPLAGVRGRGQARDPRRAILLSPNQVWFLARRSYFKNLVKMCE